MQFVLHETGFDAVETRLLRFERTVVNMRPVLERIGARLEGEIEKNFARESAAGKSWAPLAASTLARKRALGYPEDILVATGALKRSLREGGANNIHQVGRDFVRVGTTDEKAAFHQKGTSKMPARPFAVVSKDFRRETVKRMQRWIVEGELR